MARHITLVIEVGPFWEQAKLVWIRRFVIKLTEGYGLGRIVSMREGGTDGCAVREADRPE